MLPAVKVAEANDAIFLGGKGKMEEEKEAEKRNIPRVKEPT